MFDNFLDGFADFPTITLTLYTQSSTFTQATGKLISRYELNTTKTAHGFQKAAIQSYIRDKVFDNVDMVFIMDTQPDKKTILMYNNIWYSVVFPDDIGFSSSVFLIGATRVEKPKLLFYVVGQGGFIIGDSTGVVGWKTSGV